MHTNEKLTFKVTEELRKIVAHTMGGSAFRLPYSRGTVAEPMLWLVHDQGVYLMSGRIERLPGTKHVHMVAHAEGCDPDRDIDCWETSHRMVGGDDFAIDLPAQFFAVNLAEGATSFGAFIRPDGKHVEITAVLPELDPAAIPDCPPTQSGGRKRNTINERTME